MKTLEMKLNKMNINDIDRILINTPFNAPLMTYGILIAFHSGCDLMTRISMKLVYHNNIKKH